MFENLKDNEKLLLNAVNGMSPSFENATVRMLLATISELRARKDAIFEVMDECDGGVSDKMADEATAKPKVSWKPYTLTTSTKEYLPLVVNTWLDAHRGLYLQCVHNEDYIHIDVVNNK